MNFQALRTAMAFCCFVILCSSLAGAQDWPHWRGPNYDGSAKAQGLPLDFTKEKHVRWAAELPGPGACTPIVVGDRVFLSSVDQKRDRLVTMCLSRTNGKVLWMNDATKDSPVSAGRRSNFASPSPTTDGETVVFFFGNGDLIGYDMEGKELWRRNLQKEFGKFAFQWTFSASPTIWEGKLFMPVLQRNEEVRRFRRRGRRGRRGRRDGSPPPETRPQESDARTGIESFLLALEPKTGKTIWKHVRPSPARMESLESYTTMIPLTGKNGRKEMLCVGGDVLTGHDPASGKELWRWGTWNPGHRQRSWRLVPSVVAGGGVALICAPKRAPVFAIKLGGSGNLDEKAVAWQSEGRPNPVSSDVPTPAFSGGDFYVLSDVRNALSKVNAKTGQVAWTTELPRDYSWRASPTAADGKIWCINHNGEVFVVDAATGKVVYRTHMGEEDDDQIRSSIVIAHGDLFIRTHTKLFCIGRKKTG